MAKEPTAEILSVNELLTRNVHIPVYQRPYKWTEKNVSQLISDIRRHKNTSAYRLGTIVFHETSNGELDIVDGQQRIVTLLLIIMAMKEIYSGEIASTCHDIIKTFSKIQFKNKISQTNIYYNYQHIVTLLKEDAGRIDLNFLLQNCEVVSFTLYDISEAFQFFDSQNTRGKDLVPHDLLKAYHLRELPASTQVHVKIGIVEQWQKSESQELNELFALYLHRIRNWIRGKPGLYFSKDDISAFKGISMLKGCGKPYPYARMWHALQNSAPQSFVFQLDHPIINGHLFFEMVARYQSLLRDLPLPLCITGKEACSTKVYNIIDTLETYPGRFRTGDRHVHTLFICLLLAYRDRFGLEQFTRAIEHSFMWGYRMRLEYARVSMESVDNYVTNNELFTKLNSSLTPEDFFSHRPASISIQAWEKNKKDKLGKVIDLLMDMGVIHGN